MPASKRGPAGWAIARDWANRDSFQLCTLAVSLPYSSLERDFCRRRQTPRKRREDNISAQRPEIGDHHAREMAVGAQFGRVQASAKVSARARSLLISYAAGEPRYASRNCVTSSSGLIHRGSPPSSSSERDFCRRRLAREKGPEDDVSAQRPEIGDHHTREMAAKTAFLLASYQLRVSGDWVVADAVGAKPVSGRNFPANRTKIPCSLGRHVRNEGDCSA